MAIGLGWFFSRPSKGTGPGPTGPVPPTGASVGTATIAQSDTPVFAEPAQNSRVVVALGTGDFVELLEVPNQPGADGVPWVRVRFSNQQTGFVDLRRLTNLVGQTDLAQHQILGLQLHPEDSELAVLEQDIGLLQDFLGRYPGSPFVPKVKLAVADRTLAIAKKAANESNPDYQKALERSRAAANAYGDASQTADASDRERAERGKQEALQLASLYDTKLNPAVVARLDADQQTVYRGQPVTLNWSTEHAIRVTLEPGLGSVEPRGTRTVRPNQPTTYRLVAHGRRGQTDATVQVSVVAPAPTVTLSATPQALQQGQPVTLTWASENAAEVFLSPGVGRVAASGSIQVTPSGSGTYQIVARGEGGEAQAQAAVSVTEAPKLVTLTIPAGTQLVVRLVGSLSSKTNKPTQEFQATLDQPISAEGLEVWPKHSEARGRVVSVKRAGRVKGVAEMSLILHQLRAGGQAYTVYTDPLPLSANPGHGKDAKTVGGGAGLGAIIGAIAGGGKGAAGGAAAGAAGGALAAILTRGPEIELPPETPLVFRLAQNVTVRTMR
jgi:hypothetical protein